MVLLKKVGKRKGVGLGNKCPGSLGIFTSRPAGGGAEDPTKKYFLP